MRVRTIAAVGGAAAGPLVAGTLVLLSDGIGGVANVPGAVVQYVALTGLVLACATLPLTRRPWPPWALALCGVGAGLAVALTGLVMSAVGLSVGLMLAGLLGGPVLLGSRAAARQVGVVTGWYAGALAGLAAAALVAHHFATDPGSGVLLAGLVAAALGTGAAALPPVPAERLRAAAVGRSLLAGYAAVGMAVGGTVLPALHLLLFRWTQIGAAQDPWLGWAALAAGLLVVAGARRWTGPRAAAALLLIAAGGPLLVATAPGAGTLAVGLGLALTAATAAAIGLDRGTAGHAATAGLTVLAVVAGALAGVGLVALVGRIAGVGTALTVLAWPIALLALPVSATPRPEPPPLPDDPRGGVLLETRGLAVRHTSGRLDEVDLRVDRGEIVAVFGPGAAVLLAVLAGRVTPADGRVLFAGTDLTEVPAEQRTLLGLCHHVSAQRRTGGSGSVRHRLVELAGQLGYDEPRGVVEGVLAVFPPLAERAGKSPAELRPPHRRLLGFAETLLVKPRLLLVDGVTSGVGAEPADALVALLRRLAADGTAVLLSETSLPVATDLAHRAYVLDGGRVAAEVPAPTTDQVAALLGLPQRGTP